MATKVSSNSVLSEGDLIKIKYSKRYQMWEIFKMVKGKWRFSHFENFVSLTDCRLRIKTSTVYYIIGRKTMGKTTEARSCYYIGNYTNDAQKTMKAYFMGSSIEFQLREMKYTKENGDSCYNLDFVTFTDKGTIHTI